MWNATTKIIMLCLVWLCAASCGDGRGDVARKLCERAEAAIASDEPSIALQLLDSLDSSCKDHIEMRRRGMHLRALAQEQLIVRQLAEADSSKVSLGALSQRLSEALERVDNPVEPYYIARGSTLSPTGLQARISPDGIAYLVSSLTGHNINHTRVVAVCGVGEAATATVAPDGELNYRAGNAETVNFVGADADSILRFITAADTPVTIRWEGRSSFSRPLTAAEQQAIATIGRYAATINSLRRATVESQRLEKQLEIVRSHAARTYSEPQDQ